MTTPIYWRNIALKAVTNLPKEDIVYAVFIAFLERHKPPAAQFITYPQLSLKWNPQSRHDKRVEVLDIGVGNFTLSNASPPFILRFGVKAKRSLSIMELLPPPASIITDLDVLQAFHGLSFQAKDQAKAAIKNGSVHSNTVQWIFLVGPYWTPVTFGPFTAAELTVRARKPSPSANWLETLHEGHRVQGNPPQLDKLFCLCNDASYEHLEGIFASTDIDAQPLIDALQ